MVAEEKRTLEIAARVRDFASSTLRRIGRAGSTLAKTLTAPFRATFRAVTSLRTAMVALLGVFAITRVKAFIDTLREGLDQLAKTTDQLGVTAESFTAVEFAAGQAGLKFEELRTGLTQFERNVENARRGARNQVEALAKLGISVESLRGNQLDLVDVLGRVGDGLGTLRSQTERATILMDLFGRSGLRLAPLLNQGSEGIRRMAEEAERLGIVFSREELRRIEAFNDSIDSLTRTLTSFAQRVLIEVAPVITEAIRELTDTITKDAGSVRRTLLDIADSIVSFFESVALAALRLKRDFENVVNFIGVQVNKITGLIFSLKQFLAEAFGDPRVTAAFEERARAIVKEGARLQEAGAAISQSYIDQAKAVEEFFDRALAKIREQRAEAERSAGIPPPFFPQVFGEGDELADAPGILEQIKRGAIEAAKPLKDLGQVAFQAGRQFTTSLAASTEALFTDLITGTRKARDAFKDFATAILRSIAQIIAKIAAAQVVRAFFSAFFPGSFEGGGVQRGNLRNVTELARGGIMQGRRNRRRFQDGGIARSPTVALFGEGDQAEAFVPLPDNKSIPVTLTGAASRGPGVLQFIINAMDGQSVRRVLIDNQSTLKAIYSNGLETQPSHRQIVQRVTQ